MILLQERCLEEPFRPIYKFDLLHFSIARRSSSTTLRRKDLECNLQKPCDQLPRELNSAQYRTVKYQIGLE